MRIRILEVWRRIRFSFWFVPSMMVAAAIGLAFSLLYFDRNLTVAGKGPPAWLAVADAESARSLVATIAGSMITVAGVTFSIVIVALTLASSQYGPRLLVGFMQDKGNQVVLGTFISVFAYCLIVLLHLPGASGSRALPQVSSLTAVALALFAVGVLIFFFHHISTSIQAGGLIQEAGISLDQAIRTVEEGGEDDEDWPPLGFSEANAKLRAPRSGYLSDLDKKRLMEQAVEHDLRILILPRAGDFVLEEQIVALVTPAEILSKALADVLWESVSVVEKREDSDDLPLAWERLTEIAVRSLSPGINDPQTAVAAIHRLTVGLDDLLERLPAQSRFCDEEGKARLFFRSFEADSVLELALGPIRHYGRGDVQVLETLVDGLSSLRYRRRPHWDPVLDRHIEKVLQTARVGLDLEHDRARIEACCAKARKKG